MTYNGTGIVYDDQGEGTCVVLLHGYLESGPIWEHFADRFRTHFRVIIPDLPGHGQSGIWGKVHTMDDLAEVVQSILDREGIHRVFLVGHSMGGYVTMAFAELYRERLLGYCLFHSTCFADNEEKKRNREREISLILCHKKRQIVNVNIPKGFATSNATAFRKQIDRAKQLAMECPDEGIMALLNGMKERPDRTHVLKDAGLPVLLIGGEKDNYIPGEVLNRMLEMAPYAESVCLRESGHMGFVEEPAAAAAALTEILKRVEKEGPAGE